MFNNLTYLAHPRSQWGKSWLITQQQLKSWPTEASLHLDLHWWNDGWVLGDLFPDLDYGIIQMLGSLWWMQRGDQWDSGVENGQASVALIHGALTPLATRWPHGGCFWQGRNIHVSNRLEVKLMGALEVQAYRPASSYLPHALNAGLRDTTNLLAAACMHAASWRSCATWATSVRCWYSHMLPPVAKALEPRITKWSVATTCIAIP